MMPYMTIDDNREQAQGYILMDLYFYTGIPFLFKNFPESAKWTFCLLGLLLPSSIDTLLSEYQYLNPLF